MTYPARVMQRGLIGSARGLTPVADSPTEYRSLPNSHAHSYPNPPATSASFHVERRVP
jgi:hypothetical protein